jgi:exodeoxyribonuclease-5
MDETIIVCRSNKRANAFNMGVRASILYREEELSVGDMLMIVKNNYHWAEDSKRMDFIANGDTARIRRIKGIDECYGFRFAHLSLEFLDYDEEIDVTVLIDTLTSESPSLSKEENKRLYKEIEQDYIDIPNKKKRFEKIRENEYYNALQVKFAYAVTCHKAQGGQWSSVFVDQGWIPTETPDLEYMRWLYTAFTRAREKLYLVNFNKEFFDDNIE